MQKKLQPAQGNPTTNRSLRGSDRGRAWSPGRFAQVAHATHARTGQFFLSTNNKIPERSSGKSKKCDNPPKSAKADVGGLNRKRTKEGHSRPILYKYPV